MIDKSLKTKSKWHHIYGFTPQGMFESIKDHWIFALISLIVGAALSAVLGIVFLDFSNFLERTLRGQIAWAMRKFFRISREVEVFNRTGIIYEIQIQN